LHIPQVLGGASLVDPIDFRTVAEPGFGPGLEGRSDFLADVVAMGGEDGQGRGGASGIGEEMQAAQPAGQSQAGQE
jgi:hypothetical protein